MLNKSLLIGRLTAQPEVKKTPTDKSVLRVNQQSCSHHMLKKGVWSQLRENYGHDGMKTRRV